MKKERTEHNPELLQDLRTLIEESRTKVATTVNATLTMLYWQIGKRINDEILKGERATYGKQIVSALSRQLQYEKDLEDAILRELEKFLLELGAGFTFIARQKRLQIDNEDFYIDLLFYNRKLKRLIAIDLKLGKFKAAHKGQMELYLRWLAKHEQEPEELMPLGIILCADKQQEQIELLELDQSGIDVAEYLTVIPQLELLKEKLRNAVETSRLRLEAQKELH